MLKTMEGGEDQLGPSTEVEDFMTAVALATEARAKREYADQRHRRNSTVSSIFIGYLLGAGTILLGILLLFVLGVIAWS